MPNSTKRDDITLEDLLQVKRAERPDDSFWKQFDKEIHQRTLTEFVGKGEPRFAVRRIATLLVGLTPAAVVAAAVAAFMLPSEEQDSTPYSPSYAMTSPVLDSIASDGPVSTHAKAESDSLLFDGGTVQFVVDSLTRATPGGSGFSVVRPVRPFELSASQEDTDNVYVENVVLRGSGQSSGTVSFF